MAAIIPTTEDFQTAADWLDNNDGDGGEAEACSRVADWLRKQADAKDLRDMARDAGVPVAKARAALAKTNSK